MRFGGSLGTGQRERRNNCHIDKSLFPDAGRGRRDPCSGSAAERQRLEVAAGPAGCGDGTQAHGSVGRAGRDKLPAPPGAR